jgi:hypothetical protein
MKTTANFETSASTFQANNLVLCVMNTGETYNDRLHCGYAMLQGSTHRVSFRDQVMAEANRQRAQMGCKFSASAIVEATEIVQAQTIEHCIESIRESWNGENIELHGRKWFDKVNGNTYFSARIVIPTVNGIRWFSVPYQYGYGDHWVHECRAVLKRVGFDGIADGYLSDKPISTHFEGAMLKRQMYRGVYL